MIEIIEMNLGFLTQQIGIDQEAVIELLKIYQSEITEELQQAQILFDRQDWHNLQRTIHNIKGVSANLYLENMLNISADIDVKLKAQDYENVSLYMSDLVNMFDATCCAIEKVVAQ